MADSKYLEDIQPGDRWQTAPYTVTEDDILSFARQWDPQPMHADPEAAARGPFRGLIASGWHTAAILMKLVAEAKPFGDTPALGLGVESLAWPQPVRPGDTIHVEMVVESVRESKSKPGFGIVKVRSTAVNQRGEPVYVCTPSCWMPRRPAC